MKYFVLAAMPIIRRYPVCRNTESAGLLINVSISVWQARDDHHSSISSRFLRLERYCSRLRHVGLTD